MFKNQKENLPSSIRDLEEEKWKNNRRRSKPVSQDKKLDRGLDCRVSTMIRLRLS